jgi:two-component system sensor histidine kinase KdpD
MGTLNDTTLDSVSDPPSARGRHKVFLGMAAGVGKTYRMLQDGHGEAEAGRDVVIGYLEPHDRADTAAQAHGLEMVRPRRVAHGELTLEEMDLPALLRRQPELALIDELAHTNAPGVEHRKRYEDINDVLAAGIDVFSTVNVQHLESLNDRVAELTGVRVRETFPDSVLAEANEVVLIDLTPQALIQRLQAGKIYPPERVPVALTNFFTIENLSALREVALRQVAEDVESKRLVRELIGIDGDGDRLSAATPEVVGERLLALASARPSAQRLVRRAWRSAQRLGAELDILHVVKPGHQLTGDERDQIDAMRRVASALGAHVLIEEGHDVARTATRVARERGTTYVLIGEPRSAKGLRRFGVSLPEKLLDLLPGVDIRIVADRTKQPTREER